VSLTDDALEQMEKLFRENQELRAERDEWHRQNGLLRGELAAANERADFLDAEALQLRRDADEVRRERDGWRTVAGQRRTRAEDAEHKLAELEAERGRMEAVANRRVEAAREREEIWRDEILPKLAEATKRAELAEARIAELGNVTDDMVTAAWEAMGWERAPYMARVSNFTREQIDNGELRAADAEAEAANEDLMRTTLAAALAVAPGGRPPVRPEPD
jgi:chromosome segregation ATPase